LAFGGDSLTGTGMCSSLAAITASGRWRSWRGHKMKRLLGKDRRAAREPILQVVAFRNWKAGKLIDREADRRQ
jgi:hypothetical protein